jgi:hypothetical protein
MHGISFNKLRTNHLYKEANDTINWFFFFFNYLIKVTRSGSLNPQLDSKFQIHDLHPSKLCKFISHPKSPTIRLHPDTNYKLTIFEVSIALFWILNSYCIYLNGPHFCFT